MANEVTLTVKGRDQGAKEAIADVGKGLTNVGNIAKGILTANLIQDIGRSAERFLGRAASAASGLEQSLGGTKAVFGQTSAAIDDFAKSSAQSVGLSEAAFRDSTTLIGGQLKRMTGDVGLAADASIQLVEVGADLAATYGGTTKQAVDAFAAALRGEADPAERFNLNLKITAVNAKAVELGLAASTGQVDENARAQALLALVMEQSADAQGQFAREADTAMVAQQKATAAWEDAQAKLGQTLLPVMVQAAEVAAGFAGVLDGIPEPLRGVTATAVIAAAAFLVLAPRIVATKSALEELGIVARLSSGRLGSVASAAGKAAGALGVLAGISLGLEATVRRLDPDVEALAVGLERWASQGQVAGEAAKLLGSDFELLDRALISAADEGFTRVTATIAEGLIPTTKNLDTSLARSVERIDSIDAALASMVQGGSGEQAAAVFEVLRQRAEANGISHEKLMEILPLYAAAQEVANAQTDEATGAQEGAAGATLAHLSSLKALADHMRAQIDPVFAFTEATRNLEEAQGAVTEAQEEHGRKSPEYEQALRDEAQAALAVLAAAGQLGDEFTGELSDAQRQMLRDAGLSAGAVRQLEEDLKDAKREADRLDGTRARIEVLAIWRQQGRPDIPVGGHFAHGGITGAAGGGPRGGSVVVNEEGPELARLPSGDVVSLPFGSTVIPAGQSAAMMQAAGGGGRVALEVSVRRGFDTQLGDAIMDMLEFRIRTGGDLIGAIQERTDG